MVARSVRPDAPARLTFPDGVGRRPRAEEDDLRGLDGLHGEPGSAAWWETVAAVGTPLWCPDGLVGPGGAGGARSGTPTLLFLHRDATAGEVYLDLVGLTDRSDLTAGAMHRVPGTDVRVAAYGVEPGFVGSYALVPHHGELRSPAPRDTPEARRWWLGVLAASGPDPLARVHQVIERQGSRRSVATVPPTEALPDVAGTAVVAGGPGGAGAAGTSGAAEAAAVGSEVPVPDAFVWDRPDGVDQPAWLHVPASLPPASSGAVDGGVDEGEGAATEVGVLVLFDGRMWAEQVPVAPVLDALHDRGAVPATVVVMLDSMNPDRREADLAGADGYLDLLADDLLPRLVAPALADRGLVLSGDPARTVVAGQSYGGLAAFRAVAHRPDRFGASVSQSGSFWWPDHDAPQHRAVPAWLASAPPRTARTVLQVGTYEGSLTGSNRQVAALVRDRGEHLVHTEVPGGHDWAWWSRRLGEGVVAALGG
ncbi:MAG TPA: alpha/beta hydrolase-fold protein [Cellulomonas sp.]